MLTLKIPTKINISWGFGFLIIEGPYGIVIKKKYNFNLAIKNSILYIWYPAHSHIMDQNQQQKKENVLLKMFALLLMGVWKGYSEKLKLVGVGFRAIQQPTSNAVLFKIGYSHDVIYQKALPVEIKISKHKGMLLRLTGVEKMHVNQEATRIQQLKYPDSYKGRGIHKKKEKLILKKGKKETKK